MQKDLASIKSFLKSFSLLFPFFIFIRYIFFELLCFGKKKICIFSITGNFTNFLSSFVIIRNERNYIKEWLCFYKLLGVEHFYVFNNQSDDKVEEVLQPFIDEKSVSLLQINDKPPMPAALYKGVNLAFKSKWLMNFDVDEFLLEKNQKIIDFLKTLNNFPALAVNWRYFGSSCLEDEGQNLVIESFRLSQNQINPHVKVIFQPNRLKKAINSHFNLYTGFAPAVDSNLQNVYGTFNPRRPADLFILNHYVIGSKKRFFNKGCKNFESIWSGSTLSKRRSPKNWDRESHLYNDVLDDEMLKYVPSLKALLEKYK